MNLKFEEFQKSHPGLKELDNLRIKNFNKFQTRGFPSKRQEHWKYTDLKNIISNNFSDLRIFEDKKSLKYDEKLLIKDFEHNRIILLNGNFIESKFGFEDEKKIKIKSLKSVFEEEKHELFANEDSGEKIEERSYNGCPHWNREDPFQL